LGDKIVKLKIREARLTFEEFESQQPKIYYSGWEKHWLKQWLLGKGFDPIKPITRYEDTDTNEIIFKQR